MLGGIVSKSVHDLHAHLLGEGQLDSLAGGSTQNSDTLLEGLGDNLNLGDGDALLLSQVLTADSGQGNGLVDTGLDRLRVDNINGRLNNGNHGDIVASLLGNLLAVVVAISASRSMTISSVLCWLAHSNHLGLAFFGECNLNGLGSGSLSFGLVGVGAHLIVDLFDALSADSPGDGVALLNIDHILAGQLHRVAFSDKSGCTDLSSLNNILDRAVVLGVFITVVGLGIGGLVVGGLVVGRLGVGWLVIGRGGTVGVGWPTGHQGDKTEKSKGLQNYKYHIKLN
jgi:hypothetical protein